jgi:hypothetical protein
MNFGLFETPERSLIFGLNDFDETLPGPFEWDVKRLAASVEIAARDMDLHEAERSAAVLGTLRARSGDPIAMAAYLGDKDTFDQAVAAFAATYAEVNRKDHRRLVTAIDSGQVTAQRGV